MNTHEMDWRIGPLQDVMAGIDAGLGRIRNRLAEESWYADLAMDDAKPLFGVAFVAAQAYIEGTIGDIWHIQHGRETRATSAEANKLRAECLSNDTPLYLDGSTRVQLINAAANHYKHGEGAGGPWDSTMRTLGKCGITAQTEYPCAAASDLLCGGEWQLHVLAEIVKEWRTRVIGKALSDRKSQRS